MNCCSVVNNKSFLIVEFSWFHLSSCRCRTICLFTSTMTLCKFICFSSSSSSSSTLTTTNKFNGTAMKNCDDDKLSLITIDELMHCEAAVRRLRVWFRLPGYSWLTPVSPRDKIPDDSVASSEDIRHHERVNESNQTKQNKVELITMTGQDKSFDRQHCPLSSDISRSERQEKVREELSRHKGQTTVTD